MKKIHIQYKIPIKILTFNFIRKVYHSVEYHRIKPNLRVIPYLENMEGPIEAKTT